MIDRFTEIKNLKSMRGKSDGQCSIWWDVNTWNPVRSGTINSGTFFWTIMNFAIE